MATEHGSCNRCHRTAWLLAGLCPRCVKIVYAQDKKGQTMVRSVKQQSGTSVYRRSKSSVHLPVVERTSMWLKACTWSNEHSVFILLLAGVVILLYLIEFAP